jgi:cytochrome c553
MLLVAALASAGCLGSALTGDGSSLHSAKGDGSATVGDGGASGNGAVDMAPNFITLFYANVAPIITSACAGCHGVADGAGPAFMMPQPDLLKNVLSYPGIIGPTPEKSRLYMKGGHEGPALTPDQAKTVHDWIAFYDASLPADGGVVPPSVSPFAPNMTAVNTIDLSAFDASLAGNTLTFMAKMVGTSIELSKITITTTAKTGVHAAHPLFVMWDQNLNPTPDPVDSFSNVDETVAAGSSAPLGPGTLIMPAFPMGGLVNVVFTTIETKTESSDGGTTTGCKNVASFKTNVQPNVTGTGGLLNCSSCHGQQGNAAANVWDIVNLANDAADGCASTLGEINTTTPAMSKIFLKVDPASATPHQGGKLQAGQVSAFESAITTWINAEK